MAYAEICTDEKAVTAIGVLQPAVAWFADHGVTVERVLSDNGSAYRSHAWRDTCRQLRIHQSGPAHTGLTPTARSSDSTAPSPTAGLRTALRVNRTTRHRSARVASLLQSPPSPLLHRRPTTGHPTDQPPWTSRLVRLCRPDGQAINTYTARLVRCRRWSPAKCHTRRANEGALDTTRVVLRDESGPSRSWSASNYPSHCCPHPAQESPAVSFRI